MPVIFAATKARVTAATGPIRVLQDPTEFIYKRDAREKIGFTKAINSGKDEEGRLRENSILHRHVAWPYSTTSLSEFVS